MKAENSIELKGSDRIPELSIVMPIYNEEDNIIPVVEELMNKLDGKIVYELIVVDDGSEDSTTEKLQYMAKAHSRLHIAQHPNNRGKSAALITGVIRANAAWIATMDGDGQNNPSDILNLFAKHSNVLRSRDLCLVAGHRSKRKDTWLKRISSKIANRFRAFLLKDNTPDTACGLKIFSRKEFLQLPMFDNMHRFLPALFKRHGGEVFFVEVEDRSRIHGKSKYNIRNRLWVGIVDLLGVMWLQHRAIPPYHDTLKMEDK